MKLRTQDPSCTTCHTLGYAHEKGQRARGQGFSALLSEVEAGEEILITKHGRPVAVLGPYRPVAITAERQKAIGRAIKLMEKGLPWGDGLRGFTRDEMHER